MLIIGDPSYCSHRTCETCPPVSDSGSHGRAWSSDVTSAGSLRSPLPHVYFTRPLLAWCTPDRNSPFTSTFVQLTGLFLHSVSPRPRVKGQFPSGFRFPLPSQPPGLLTSPLRLPLFLSSGLFHPHCSHPSL